MKTLTKKAIISLIIALIMIMNLVPFGAISQVYATTDYDLWIGGTRVTSENLSGEGWTYNPSTNVLTLDNYNYTSATASIDDIRAGIYSKNDIVINLIGTNIINEMSENSSNSFGIFVDWNSSTKLTFKGNGVLTSSGTTTSNTTGYSNCGIAAGELVLDKNFTGTINANGGTSSASNAMATMGLYTKSLTVNSGTINAQGGTASNSYASSSGIFMGAPATININGGTVNTYGGTGGTRGQSVGLWMYGEYEGDTGTIVVKRNSTLSAKGSNAQLSYGINFENSNGGSINISSGANVTCWSTNTSIGNSMGDVYSCGLRTDGNSLTSMGNLTVYTEGTSTRANDTVCAISGGTGSYSIYQGKGYTDAEGTEGETILQTSGVTSSLMSYKHIVTTSEPVVNYNLWVGSTQVTSANKDDVLGDGKVTYNPSTQTLDFDDVTINDYHIQWDNDKVGIFSQGIDLTITGKVNIPSTNLWASIGVYSETSSKINCNFNGDITVANQILIQGNLAIIGGSLTKTTNGTAIYANGLLTIESAVTKIDVMSYIYVEDGITIESPLVITSPDWLTITNGETTSMGSLSAYDTTRIVIEHPLPSTHTVTFNLNGGTMTGDTSVVVNDGETIAEPNPAPTKDGNTFGGWYADSLFNTPFDFTTPITTDDVQIYAKWNPAKYTITLAPNNGTTETDNITNIDYNQSYGLGSPSSYGFTTPAGKEFDGWLISGNKYSAGQNFTVTSDLTAVAQWVDTTTPHTHELTLVPATAPTCMTIGNNAYYTCSGCDKVFKDATGTVETTVADETLVIVSDAHDWDAGTITTPATCTTEGVKTYICNHNSSHTKTEPVAKLAHTIVPVAAVTPTCEDDGNIAHYKCSVCNKLFEDATGTVEITSADVVDPATGHNWGAWTTTTPATETADGVETRTCTKDTTHIETRPIPKLSHTHTLTKTDEVPATCESAGTKAYWTCSGCHKMFSDSEGTTEIDNPETITALGHDWNEWVETTPATVDSEGVKTRTCKNDSTHTETDSIAKLALTITEGTNSEYEIDSSSDVLITCNGTFSNFKELQLDGVKIDSSNYTVESGSTKATLKASYLNTLSEGTHTLKFVYNDDRTVETTIKIAKASTANDNGNNNSNTENNSTAGTTNNSESSTSTGTTITTNTSSSPKTGDNIAMYIALMVISTLGLFGTVKYLRKRD